MRGPISLHAIVGVTAYAVAAAAPAGIVYVDIEDASAERLPVTLDFNNDGSVDFFVVRTEDIGVSVAGIGDNEILRLTPTSQFATYLVDGSVIDDGGPYGTSGFLAQVFCEQGACAWFGPFTQVNDPGFVGAKFLIDGMTHFGWIQIGVSRVSGVATVFDFAWETLPNTPIAAGQVPAPGSAALLAGLVALRRRRR